MGEGRSTQPLLRWSPEVRPTRAWTDYHAAEGRIAELKAEVRDRDVTIGGLRDADARIEAMSKECDETLQKLEESRAEVARLRERKVPPPFGHSRLMLRHGDEPDLDREPTVGEVKKWLAARGESDA